MTDPNPNPIEPKTTRTNASTASPPTTNKRIYCILTTRTKIARQGWEARLPAETAEHPKEMDRWLSDSHNAVIFLDRDRHPKYLLRLGLYKDQYRLENVREFWSEECNFLWDALTLMGIGG